MCNRYSFIIKMLMISIVYLNEQIINKKWLIKILLN